MTTADLPSTVAALAERCTGEMTTFLRDMIAIPSESAGERGVVARVADEMRRVGFDEVKIDGLGNVLGRVGDGPTVIAIDGHLDTVGVGDRVDVDARPLPSANSATAWSTAAAPPTRRRAWPPLCMARASRRNWACSTACSSG